MPTTPHVHPGLSFYGAKQDQADTQGLLTKQAKAATLRETSRAPLLDELPELLTITTGFETLFVGNTVTNPNHPAWYELARIEPQSEGQELFLNALTIEQWSADTGGLLTGQGVALPWADLKGRGAAIVIGENIMPAIGGPGGWIEQPFNYPGMVVATAGDFASLDQPIRRRQELFSIGWVPGSMNDAVPIVRITPKSFGAFGKRIGFGSALQVAFVVRKNTLDPEPTEDRSIYGHCVVQLHFGATFGTGQFRDGK